MISYIAVVIFSLLIRRFFYPEYKRRPEDYIIVTLISLALAFGINTLVGG